MNILSDYLDDYAARNPGWREKSDAFSRAFFEDCPDTASLTPIDPRDCKKPHMDLAGPNMDIGQCPDCWMPMGAMRPYGESYGWHLDDCSLTMLHPGYCVPGGDGHVMPDGWKLRG